LESALEANRAGLISAKLKKATNNDASVRRMDLF
jgi:hypothetical protein